MATNARKIKRQNSAQSKESETVSHVSRERKAFKNACRGVATVLIIIALVSALFFGGIEILDLFSP